MSDTRTPPRDRNLKSNVLPFPALTHAAPDPRPPSLLRGFINLVVLVVMTGLICLTAWALIAL